MLLGKGLILTIKGRPADEIITNLNKDFKNLKTIKERVHQLENLIEQSESTLSNTNISKQEFNEIKSILDKVKQMEKSKLESQVKDFSKKVKEYGIF